MAQIESAGRGVPGAVVVKAGEHFTDQYSHNRDELQFLPVAREPGCPAPREIAAGPRLERLVEHVHALGPFSQEKTQRHFLFIRIAGPRSDRQNGRRQ